MASAETIDVESIVDPALYFLKNKEYHDCHFKVGDPATDKVERIGVVSSNLIAHSTVFRHMLKGSDLADPTGENTHIKDVSPEVFKLLLIHMYSGQLPSMSRDVAAELTLCADKYNVQPLVSKTSALLKPTTVPEVFPALRCVVYVSLPELEQLVMNFVQQQTDVIVKTKEFLELDGNCVEFITKQQKLAITELELWKILISWASKRVDANSNLRQHLDKLLKSVRLLTLTHEEILNEVMPTKVLTSEETVDVLSAVVNKLQLTSPKLCNTREKRGFFQKASAQSSVSNVQNIFFTQSAVETKVYRLKGTVYCTDYQYGRFTELEDYERSSNFTINTRSKEIELKSFRFMGRSSEYERKKEFYMFNSSIRVHTFAGGIRTETKELAYSGEAMVHEMVTMVLKLDSGEPLVLKPSSSYNFIVNFTAAHPVFIQHKSKSPLEVCDKHLGTVKFNSPLHVQEIEYMY